MLVVCWRVCCCLLYQDDGRRASVIYLRHVLLVACPLPFLQTMLANLFPNPMPSNLALWAMTRAWSAWQRPRAPHMYRAVISNDGSASLCHGEVCSNSWGGIYFCGFAGILPGSQWCKGDEECAQVPHSPLERCAVKVCKPHEQRNSSKPTSSVVG